ncbi:MAG: hypothetical protein KC442_20310 [Thermomicrobiales bacterium]|nr:hypothetical protein [Thermomicrobiales bacterium]
MKPALALLLVILLAGAGALFLRPAAPPPNPVTRASPAATPFAAGFRSQLASVLSAGEALVDLGERRERNLLVVRQRQSAMIAALDATDAWLAQHPAAADDPAVAAYRTGSTRIRAAMAEAQAAFLRFDWDAIAAANDTLRQGVADLTTARDLLPEPAG